ncbi:hypothetical protein FOVG_03868 [Fusarium oxysporum f. sp. pisi HDV247]|uniref:Uncharacterized protein n=1 Tax=Fusarium oxysporum f. sp. pisi HDV247 TaxID=1080344 RepID=W9PMQ4_FUSOX|nr:hypothetical protein FOVG_03868 [Fusarium oxysporum f. sp. pisi HDV247]
MCDDRPEGWSAQHVAQNRQHYMRPRYLQEYLQAEEVHLAGMIIYIYGILPGTAAEVRCDENKAKSDDRHDLNIQIEFSRIVPSHVSLYRENTARGKFRQCLQSLLTPTTMRLSFFYKDRPS